MTVPPSLLVLLQVVVRPCFTTPTFRTFSALVTGLIVQRGRRTVLGILLGVGLTRLWPHDRAHYVSVESLVQDGEMRTVAISVCWPFTGLRSGRSRNCSQGRPVRASSAPEPMPAALATTIAAITAGAGLTWAPEREGTLEQRLRQELDVVVSPRLPPRHSHNLEES